MPDFEFAPVFVEKIRAHDPDFAVVGMATAGGRIYPVGTDTKVLSTAFELVVRPLIFEIAADHDCVVHEPESQNFYPDFTIMTAPDDPRKLAVDVKTTYRNLRADGKWTARFTLGSYTSFMRNETKNIAFPYSDYARHIIVGFIYSRYVPAEIVHAYDVADLAGILSPVRDVEWFVQEKHRISGEQPGSGNTTNIGSIVGTSVGDFASGAGPFAELGDDVFVDYWRNYGRTKSTSEYRNLAEYRVWKAKQSGS